MSVTGLVQSLKKDRTGLKLDNGKWYGGAQGLSFNKGDKIELELDEQNKDDFGNPSISHVKLLAKAPNPFNNANFKGGNSFGSKPAFKSFNNDPETQERIARSHAITTAIAFLGLQGKKNPSLQEAFSLAEQIKAFTAGDKLASPAKDESFFGDEE